MRKIIQGAVVTAVLLMAVGGISPLANADEGQSASFEATSSEWLVAQASNESLHVQAATYDEAYRAVVDEWRTRIARDKVSSNGIDYDESDLVRTYSPKRIGKAKTGDAFVYGYVDLGISDIPGMVVADPDADFMTYGIYQCYETAGGYEVAYATSHFRYWKYPCEGGYFRARYSYPAISRDGYPFNMDYAVERARLQDGESRVYLAFDVIENVGYSGNASHYWHTDSSGSTTFHSSGANAAKAAIIEKYPIDGSIEWHKVIGAFVGPETQSTEGQMFRLYNPYSGEHFYTASETERDMLVGLGWQYEGIGWTAPTSSETPVFRMYNSYAGEHHYTMDAAERDALAAAGWDYEGIGWYSDDEMRTPLYRDYNPNEFANNHNYTADAQEHATLMGVGWVDEGYAWYGV